MVTVYIVYLHVATWDQLVHTIDSAQYNDFLWAIVCIFAFGCMATVHIIIYPGGQMQVDATVSSAMIEADLEPDVEYSFQVSAGVLINGELTFGPQSSLTASSRFIVTPGIYIYIY